MRVNGKAGKNCMKSQAINTWIFYTAALPVTIFFAVIIVISYPVSTKKFRYNFSKYWANYIIKSLNFICGVTWEINGEENLSKTPCIYLSRHESVWETIGYHTIMGRSSMVAKKELLAIPFFNILMLQIDPIIINRDGSTKEIIKIKKEGIKKLNNGYNIIVFPEGTRMPPGTYKEYYQGGALLAKAANVGVIFISINSGNFWNKKSLIIQPGKIIINISKKEDTNLLSTRQIGAKFNNWIVTKKEL